MITHVKRCMETETGYEPIDDGEDIFFANTTVKDGSDQSELLQLFLRRDAFDDARFPELSKAVKYFKGTEGGLREMCKTIEDYAEERILEARKEAISKLLQKGLSKEFILSLDYSEAEVEAVQQEMLVRS